MILGGRGRICNSNGYSYQFSGWRPPEAQHINPVSLQQTQELRSLWVLKLQLGLCLTGRGKAAASQENTEAVHHSSTFPLTSPVSGSTQGSRCRAESQTDTVSHSHAACGPTGRKRQLSKQLLLRAGGLVVILQRNHQQEIRTT